MARYLGPREKIERRLKVKLFLKGERSLSPKSATVKRMYPPGVHGKAFAGRMSEFGQQLQSKQRVRKAYRLMERQFRNTIERAISGKEEAISAIVKGLERRLDNTVYRSGFAQSRDQARQLVNHGHITVNDKKVSIPSFEVKNGDVLKIRPGSDRSKYFTTLVPQWIKKFTPPQWIELDSDNLIAKVKGVPTISDSGIEFKDIQSLIEFYSR